MFRMNSYWILICFTILISTLNFRNVDAYMPQLMDDLISDFDAINSGVYSENLDGFGDSAGEVANTSEKVMGAIPVSEYDQKLNLGDVLVNKDGEIFFYLSTIICDSTSSKLLQASTGAPVDIQDISSFLLRKFCVSGQSKLNYSDDPEVLDEFIVLQEYEDYILLLSINHSIAFVASRVSVDSFIRKDLKVLIEDISRKEQKSNNESEDDSDSDNDNDTDESDTTCDDVEEAENIETEDYESDKSNSLGSSSSNSSNTSSSEDTQVVLKCEKGDIVLSREYVTENLVSVLKKKKLSIENSISILKAAEKVFREDDMIEYINVENDENIVVVGDIHGQYLDLLRIFKRCGWPSKDKKYLFNGDIVDRGDSSIECLMLLYALKITCPNYVFINRGNHESEMCRPGRFYKDSKKFDPTGEFYREAQRGFVALPVASVINHLIYVVHGGIRGDYPIYNISEMDRFNLNKYTEKFVHICLWDDPANTYGIRKNKDRGGKCKMFGPDVTSNFIKANGFKRVIRSHTFVEKGFLKSHNKKLWTIFSAPNYCGRGNKAAVIVLNHLLERKVERFRPRNHNEEA